MTTTEEALTLRVPAAAGTEWRALFTSIERDGAVPGAAQQTIDAQHAVFRGMYLDLGEVKSAIAAARVRPIVVTVYADVLNIPEAMTWLLEESALVIIARRVQIGALASVALDFRRGKLASLTFFADEVEGSLKVVVSMESQQPSASFIKTPPPKGGLHVTWKHGEPIDLTRAQGMPMTPTEDMQRAFTTEMIFAALLFDQQPKLALSMLSWLKAWAGASEDLIELFLRSSSLLAHLAATADAKENGAAFVPYLSSTVYKDLVGAYVSEAQQYESEYRTLAVQRVVNDEFIELAKRLAAQQTYQSQYVEKVIEQAKANYDHAMNAVGAADRNFATAKQQVEMLEADFKEIGIPAFKRAAIADAIISLGSAIVTFGTAIGSMVGSGGATGGAAAQGALDAAKAVEKAAAAGSDIAKVSKGLGDIMAKLKKVAEGLGKLFTFVQKIISVAGDLSKAGAFAEEMRELSLASDGAELTATYQWEVYKLTTDEAMKEPVQKGVGYASDLKMAVATLAIYGQAAVAARLAAVTAGQQYANALLQRELARQQQKNLDEYVAKLKAGDAPIVELMQQLYQRYLDTKTSLYVALLGYRASYAYWALQPSDTHPRIIDPVNKWNTGLKDLTAIFTDLKKALERLRPEPQELTSQRIVIDDPKVIETLRATGAARWNIPLSAPALSDFDRVRLRRVRIWLEGANAGSGSVTVVIKTSGSYLDRLADTRFQFTAQPLTREFKYEVSSTAPVAPHWKFDDGTYGKIIVDGEVDREVQYAYFEPTAFTQWEIKVKSGDASKVTSITMELAGSIMTNLSAAELQRRAG